MNKKSVITTVVIILVLAIIGFIAYTWFKNPGYEVHTNADFDNYEYVQFSEVKTEIIDDNSVAVTEFDTRYLAPGVVGNDYIYVLESIEGRTVTTLSTGRYLWQDSTCCKGVNLRATKITTLKQYSFVNWECLEFLLLPDTLTNVEDYFLYNCPVLTTIQFNSEEPPKFVFDNSFTRCIRLSRIEVPIGSEVKYKAALPEKFQDLIVGVDKFQRITENENTEKSYIQVIVDGEIQENYTYIDVATGFNDKTNFDGLGLTSCYPIFTVKAYSSAGDSEYVFDLNVTQPTVRESYAITFTRNGDFVKVELEDQSKILQCDEGCDLLIEFYLFEDQQYDDSFYYDLGVF